MSGRPGLWVYATVESKWCANITHPYRPNSTASTSVARPSHQQVLGGRSVRHQSHAANMPSPNRGQRTCGRLPKSQSLVCLPQSSPGSWGLRIRVGNTQGGNACQSDPGSGARLWALKLVGEWRAGGLRLGSAPHWTAHGSERTGPRLLSWRSPTQPLLLPLPNINTITKHHRRPTSSPYRNLGSSLLDPSGTLSYRPTTTLNVQ